MRVDTDAVSWFAQTRQIVKEISLAVASKEFIGLVGPNGSGKSTLLRMIYRVYKPHTGIVRLNENDVWTMTAKEMARQMAVVTQENPVDFDFTVKEIVLMGRNPHKNIFDRDTTEDEALVQTALSRVGMIEFQNRDFSTLSGGEKQRTLIARALAQQANVLILDEPTNHLDIKYQLEVLDLVRSLNVTTIAALHDLNLAAMYCDRLYLLDDGKVAKSGTPYEVLVAEEIEAVYGVKAEVETRTSTGRIYIFFTSLRASI